MRVLTALILVLTFHAFAQPAQLSPEFKAAQQLFTEQKWAEAAAAYEKLVANDAKDPRPRAALAASLYYLGEFNKALPIALEANRLLSDPKVQFQYPGLPPGMVMARVARIYNRLGKTDLAFEWLEKAANYPIPNFASLESEADLANLRADGRWKRFIDTVRGNTDPCNMRAEFHQFDFWLGEWDVLGAAGQKLGTSKIERVLNQCAIFETYTALPGTSAAPNYVGQAFHYFDANTNRWAQFYLDTTGTPFDWVGEFSNGVMKFERKGPYGPSKLMIQQRMTFSPLPEGKVRQLFQQSIDGGKTWSTGFDGTYVKRVS